MEWTLLGKTKDLVFELEASGGIKELDINERKYVLAYFEGEFSVLNNKCNHMEGRSQKAN